MVFSRAAGYGIRALSYLARYNDLRLCALSEIAENEKIPPVYLRKLLGELRRHCIVESVKGIHGGYFLAKSPQNITLWDVFKVLNNESHLDRCVLCHSHIENPACPFCREWRRIAKDIAQTLKNQTIAEYSASLKTFS